MNKKEFPLPSLAQYFDPPEGYVGHFGWMVGFSADAEFMNDAAERFTGYTKLQRASQGSVSLALFLNDHNPPITMGDAPGVAHLPFADLAKRPCKLVHAKVALLGFRSATQHDKWCVRLLVATGNWTRQTLTESLDLAWAVDVCNEQLIKPNTDVHVQAACADIKAAHDLMHWLCNGADGFFNTDLLQAKQVQEAQQQLNGWISQCIEKAKGSPRFFDNRKKSLLAQLPGLVKNTREVKRDYLALGSGFYEGSKKPNVVPTVPQSIINDLKKKGLLIDKTKIDLFVNTQACQSVATSVDALKEQGIKVKPAKEPEWMKDEKNTRNLHAKFLFSANISGSDKCNSAWIYLGSGNLTKSGFTQKMSKESGNLEAGVVFGVNGLLWKGDNKTKPARIVTNLLPIHWDESFEISENLKVGDGWEPEPPTHFAPPVPWLVWNVTADGVSELRVPENTINRIPFVIVDASGSEVQQSDEAFSWTGEQPQQVRCRWQDDNEKREGIIPVMDTFGRIAAMKLPPIENMEEAWLQLADFPNPPEVDDPGEMDGSPNESGSASPTTSANSSPAFSYPIRQMMELIEQIAAKQTNIPVHDWPLWCRRLEQTLVQAKSSTVVEYFVKELELNPLAALRQAPFRPGFAEDDTSDAGKKYEEALKNIEDCWGVHGLTPLGEHVGGGDEQKV